MPGERRWTGSIVAALAVGAALLVVPRLHPACDGLIPTAMGGAVPMRCAHTYRVEAVLSWTVLLLALCALRLGSRDARRFGGATLALLGGLVGAVPQGWLIGTCSGGSCHVGGGWFTCGGMVLVALGAYAAVGAASRTAAAPAPSLHV